MKPLRRLSRRSFLGRVVGGVVAGGGALTLLTDKARALQVTDNDSGPNSDPPGGGRGHRTGLTDGDPVDPAGNGRGRRTPGCTDADTGANADVANQGRGNGVTDNDTAAYADPRNCGRGPPRR